MHHCRVKAQILITQLLQKNWSINNKSIEKNLNDDNDHIDVNFKTGGTGLVDIASVPSTVKATVEGFDNIDGVQEKDISATIGLKRNPNAVKIMKGSTGSIHTASVEPNLEDMEDIDGEIEAAVIDSVIQDKDHKSTIKRNKNQNTDTNTILCHDHDSDNVGMRKTILPSPPKGCNLVIPL